MKSLSSEQLAYRQSRGGVSCQVLFWMTAKDRETGDPESIGFWTGDDHQTFSINSEGRTYYAAGNLLNVDDIIAQVGIQVRTLQVTLTGLSDEVVQAMKGYDPRLAPVEIHLATFETDTGNLIEEPELIFEGSIDQVVWNEGSIGGEATVTVDLVGVSRALTRTETQKYSDASQRLRNPADGFFKYTDVTTASDVWWGSKRAPSTSISTPTGNKTPFDRVSR